MTFVELQELDASASRLGPGGRQVQNRPARLVAVFLDRQQIAFAQLPQQAGLVVEKHAVALVERDLQRLFVYLDDELPLARQHFANNAAAGLDLRWRLSY